MGKKRATVDIGLYTLDVGHGLCQIILLPDRRAIVIDGGSSESRHVLNEFLTREVDQIEAYIATHNDRDHIGASTYILARYPNRKQLKYIYAVVDRGSEFDLDFIEYAIKRKTNGSVEDFIFGYLPQGNKRLSPYIIFKENDVLLELLYPSMVDAYSASRQKKKSSKLQNRTSACLRLTVGKYRALITGDIDVYGLNIISNKYLFNLSADVLTVPHHGGWVADSSMRTTWEELIDEIHPSFAIVSSGIFRGNGTINTETFAPLVRKRVPIVCTQLTNKCHPNISSLHTSNIVQKSEFLPQYSGHPKSRNRTVACHGSILINMTTMELVDMKSHERDISMKISKKGTPMCKTPIHNTSAS